MTKFVLSTQKLRQVGASLTATAILSGTIFSQALIAPGSRSSGTATKATASPVETILQSPNAIRAKSPFSGAGRADSIEVRLAPETEPSHIDGNMRISDATGFPAAIYGSSFKPTAETPVAKAFEYLRASKSLLGLTDRDISHLRVHNVRNNETGFVVRLRQTYKGLPVNNNAEITIHINRQNVVDFVQNGFRYGIDLPDVTPLISRNDARNLVVDRLRSSDSNFEKTQLMVLNHGGQDYLVYRINIEMDNPVGDWEAYIDAKSGTVLKLEDVAYYHREQRNISGDGAILATGTGNVFDPDPLTTATATYGGAYVDGSDANAAVLTAQLKSVTLNDITLSAGTYSLEGPYAAIRDFEAPNKGLFTQASPTFAFDRNADTFEAVNTYYHIDSMMRYLNTTLGLSLMPYQYVGGVQFDPSGLSGADNSHYLTASGRLAFGEGGVDDAEDADVIIHELGHGLHDWVTSGGLSQVNGLSEGTGDYIAGSYSRAKGYWGTAQAAYNWTFNWDGHNPFWGGRILNYGSVYPAGLTGSIHTDGQIWATANMRIWDDIGRQKADRAFWRGLALTNASTNQNDAAVAVMQAATTLGYTFAERTAMRNRFVAAGYTMPPIAPTAATVSVSGRVANAGGAGIRNAVLTLTDAEGNSRTVSTGTFGYFSFTDVPSGATYTISVRAKRFVFDNPTQVLTIGDNAVDVDFTAVSR